MDQLRGFLETVKQHSAVQGQFRGLLHVLIGRRIARRDGTLVSAGLTWREVAVNLRRLRWEPEAVADLGLQPDDLPIRDRERFWYAAIVRAGVESKQAIAAGDKIARAMLPLGFVIGPAPKSQND